MAYTSPEQTLQTLVAGNGGEGLRVPGCAAAIIRNGRVVWAGSAGRRVVDGAGGPPMLPGTKMRVASITKVAVALLALKQVEAGRLTLDGDVSPALGFPLRNPAFPDTPITLRQLLSHTSSMRDDEVYWGTLGERMADFFTPGGAQWADGGHWAPEHAPGAYFTYCNLAFGVIATMIERVTGERFDLHATRTLFAPLGLTCGFNWSGVPSDDVAAGATLYRTDTAGAWVVQTDAPESRRSPTFLTKPDQDLAAYKPGENGALFNPQGGLRASILDLARLGLLLLNRGQPFLKPATFAAMTQPVWASDRQPGVTTSGLHCWSTGLHILTGSIPGDQPIPGQARPLFGHMGEAYGLLAALWVDPTTNAGFAYAITGSNPSDREPPGLRSGFKRVEEVLSETLYRETFA